MPFGGKGTHDAKKINSGNGKSPLALEYYDKEHQFLQEDTLGGVYIGRYKIAVGKVPFVSLSNTLSSPW